MARLVDSYRAYGHRQADINPLNCGGTVEKPPELLLERYPNLEGICPEGIVYWKSVQGKSNLSVEDCLELLQRTYAAKTGFEFMHLEVVGTSVSI